MDAVTLGGMVTVSFGSTKAATGKTWELTTPVLSLVSSAVTIDTGLTSEPVPDVVGTATTGRAPLGFLSSGSSTMVYSQTEPPLTATSAIPLAESMALPPPSPTTTSHFSVTASLAPSSTADTVGFGGILSYRTD